MLAEIKIRKATTADIQTLLSFEQGVITAERPFNPAIKNGTVHYYDIESLINAENTMLLMAEEKGEPIGCGYARIVDSKPYLQHPKHAYMGFMYVKPEYRGKGVNKRIVQALTEWAAAKSVTEVRLDVYLKNEAAVKAYEKAGFRSHMVEMRLTTGAKRHHPGQEKAGKNP